MIQINPLKSYIDGGVRAALTTPPSASLVFDLPGKAIWVKGVKLKGIDHTYTFNHDNYITLTNTPDKNNPESEDIKIGVNITTLKNVIDTTYNGGTLALLLEGLNTEERTWLAKILHNYINNVLSITKNLKINGTNYAIYTTADSLPLFFVPVSLGTTGQILACTSSGLIWVDLIQNTDYRVSLSSATNNSDYRIILKQGADNNPETDFVRFSEYLTFNPYTKTLKINNIKVVTATDIYAGSNAGLVPTATSAQLNYYLRGDGTWVNITTEMAAANTWRPIKVGNTDALGSGTNTGTLSFIAGTGIALSWDATNKRIIITNSSPDVNHNTDENVRQVPKTDNVNRPLMMINGSTSAGEQINTSMFSTGIYANASTKMITANGFIKAGSSDNYVLLGGGNHKALSDFAISYHNHYRIKLSDDRAKYPGQLTGNDTMSTFGGFMQNSTLGISNFGSYSDVLVIRSYADSSGGNDNAIIFNKNTRGVWHTQFGFGSTTSWGTPYLFLDSNNFNKYTPTLTGTGANGTWNININGNATTAIKSEYSRSLLGRNTSGSDYDSNISNLVFAEWNTMSDNRWYLKATGYECRVNYATNAGNAATAINAIVWKRTWERSHDCLVDIPFSETRIYMADSNTANKPCSGAGFIIGHSWDWGYGGAMIYQDFDGNDGGRLYTNSRQCDGAWQGWNKVAFVKEIPIVTDYYWANIKVSPTSSTSTYPIFGSLSVVNDSCNNSIDALAYFQHRSNNDWTVKIDSGSYDYGLYINASGNYALSVGPGASRFRGSVIVGADVTPSFTLDIRGTTRSTDRIYANEWIQFDNWTGLYSPNNNAHFYPNNTTSFGQWQLRGNRNNYSGIHFGDSTYYMTIMDSGTHKGLYSEGWGDWILYFNLDSKRLGLRTSSLTGYAVTCEGDFYCRSGWLRTEGATGWYNESYGGGWYMTDTTYIRVYGSKRVYNDNTSQYAFYTSGGMTALGHIWSSSSAQSWLNGQKAETAALNIAASSDTGSYWPWFRQTLTAAKKWISVGTLSTSLYFIGSTTSRTDNSYDYGFVMNFSNGTFTSSGSIYATHFYENSDIRYKKILNNLLINSNTIANLPLFDFEWIENNTIGTGTSAQAVQEILPNIVSGTDKLTLDYGVLGTIAGITACKELVTLKSEIEQLKEKVKLLEDKLRKYENTL